MRNFENVDEYEDEAKELNAKPWMFEALKMNPGYNAWGNFEDYMMIKGGQWSEPLVFDSWKKFGPWNLDDLNEVVNFYFEVSRDSENCGVCGGEGYNPETKKLSVEFYSFEDSSKKWCDKITQDEVDALVEHSRIKKVDGKNPTAEEVNSEERNRHMGNVHIGPFGHDAINRWILIETRAKRLGVWGHCAKCNGRGYVFTEDRGHLNLQLWVIHPRKGASRGLYIKNIQREELPEVVRYLKDAAERNTARFGGLETGIQDTDQHTLNNAEVFELGASTLLSEKDGKEQD